MHDFAAEQAYLFRHALLREAAYSLQPPVDRARLHELALELLQAVLGSGIDPFAAELAEHARQAREQSPAPPSHLAASEVHFLQRAAAHARGLYHNEEALRAFARLAGLPAAGLHEQCEAQRAMWDLFAMAGRRRQALYAARRAVVLARRIGDGELVGSTLSELGLAHYAASDIPAASAATDAALEAFRLAGNADRQALTLTQKARLLVMRGEVPPALALLETAMKLLESSSDRLLVANGLHSLGIACRASGDYRRSADSINSALGIYRQLDDRRRIHAALANIGFTYRMMKRLGDARRATEEALSLAREIGNRPGEGNMLEQLASIAEDEGNRELSYRLRDQGLHMLREVGDRRTEGIALANLANSLRRDGRLEQAERTILLSLQIRREVHDQIGEAMSTSDLARIYTATGREDEARAAFGQAAAMYERLGNPAAAALERRHQATLDAS
jgi:tetratricopeptide (TPR) repeat protein